jgi:integrase
LPDFVLELIERHCTHVRFDSSLPLFRNPDSEASMWAHNALTNVWKAACASIGIPYSPPYQCLKHVQVSALRESGVPIDDIVEQCRWTSKEMMERYDVQRDDRRDKVTAQLGRLAAGSLQKNKSGTNSHT